MGKFDVEKYAVLIQEKTTLKPNHIAVLTEKDLKPEYKDLVGSIEMSWLQTKNQDYTKIGGCSFVEEISVRLTITPDHISASLAAYPKDDPEDCHVYSGRYFDDVEKFNEFLNKDLYYWLGGE